MSQSFSSSQVSEKHGFKTERLSIASGVSYEVSTLPNGVRIATAEMPHMASASLGLWSSVGSRHETASEHGVAHFVEHMLFKGTASRTATAIAREVEGVGGSLDAYTSEDHTCYYARGPADLFEPMADVLADMYQHPALKPADIDNERAVIKEEIAMVYDQPSQYLDDLLSAAAWGSGNPLGRSITGTVESLEKLEHTDLKSFFERCYVGCQTIVTAAGNITHEQTLAAIAPRLDKMSAGKAMLVDKPERQAQADSLCVATRETEQTHFAIAFHAFDRHDDKRFAQKLLSVLLGENMSSILFQKLREEEAVCYSIQTDITTFEDAGLFHIYCALDPQHLNRALQVIANTLNGLRQQVQAESFVKEAKAYAIGQSQIALESTSSQMTWVGESIMAHGRLIDPADAQARLEAVNCEDICRVANELFDPGRLVMAAVGPEGIEPILVAWRDEFGKSNK